MRERWQQIPYLILNKILRIPNTANKTLNNMGGRKGSRLHTILLAFCVCDQRRDKSNNSIGNWLISWVIDTHRWRCMFCSRHDSSLRVTKSEYTQVANVPITLQNWHLRVVVVKRQNESNQMVTKTHVVVFGYGEYFLLLLDWWYIWCVPGAAVC